VAVCPSGTQTHECIKLFNRLKVASADSGVRVITYLSWFLFLCTNTRTHLTQHTQTVKLTSMLAAPLCPSPIVSQRPPLCIYHPSPRTFEPHRRPLKRTPARTNTKKKQKNNANKITLLFLHACVCLRVVCVRVSLLLYSVCFRNLLPFPSCYLLTLYIYDVCVMMMTRCYPD